MVLEVDDHGLAIRIAKFKMPEPIGNDKFEKRLNYNQIWYTEVSVVADHD